MEADHSGQQQRLQAERDTLTCPAILALGFVISCHLMTDLDEVNLLLMAHLLYGFHEFLTGVEVFPTADQLSIQGFQLRSLFLP